MPIEITMPALSPTMKEGNLAKWHKKEGDEVAPGDVLAEIETDKATMEVEAVDEGVLGKVLIGDGTQAVKVGEVIGLLLEEGEEQSSLDNYEPPKAAANDSDSTEEKTESAPAAAPALTPKPVAMPQPAPSVAAKPAPVIHSGGRVIASPLAKRIAADKGVDLGMVAGSGPKGRIIKADVLEAAVSGGSGVVRRHPQEYTPVANSNMRRVIASRLLESKQQVPHFYLSVDCQLDRLLEVRADLNNDAPKDEEGKPAYKISVNDLIIKASALALKKIPQANASWTDEAILMYNNVDVSVAVAIDGGLITPIIRNADQKKITTISAEMKSLAKRAKEGTLAPEEFQGGGFSISNLGMYGIKNFNAIINPPQGCILSIGTGEKQAVVVGDEVNIATVMTVSLSCDHRVVDGAVGAEFLAAFKQYIEKPVTMFV